jgi:hypothetical protein
MLYSPCRVLLVALVFIESLQGKLFFFTSLARIGKPCIHPRAVAKSGIKSSRWE